MVVCLELRCLAALQRYRRGHFFRHGHRASPGMSSSSAAGMMGQHRAALADGRHAYFIARIKSEPAGFAIVSHIKRLAVVHPGFGHGKALLAKLVELIFRDTDAHRISLGVFPDNARARRAYEAVGFRVEGLARGSAFFGGV